MFIKNMFITNICKNISNNIYDELSNSIIFENIINGRKGAILVKKIDNSIPIVRTTTNYKNPVQYFLPIHLMIIDHIKEILQLPLEFNNAMIEIYNNTYTKMKFHTDQSLDLLENSYICLFSCYKDLESDLRQLVVKNKNDNTIRTIDLHNNSFVIFSTSTNKQFLHKIVGNTKEWLGITFRCSKTFIDSNLCFKNNNKIIRIANELEIKEMYKYKSLENKTNSFNYPDIDYTLNSSDLIFIK